jgi:ATP-dependent exoDNAse (exonuclease V) beta subunit
MFARWVEEQKTVWDKQERCLRPVRWRDFAVLTPTRGAYEILEPAFEREGVPAIFAKNMNYYARGEVTDVINTLRAAAFPGDETALAGWLASPFSGVPQDGVQSFLQTLAKARKSPGTESPADSLFRLLRECLPDAAERLARLRRAGSLKGPSAVLSLLLEDRRWLSAFGGAQRLRVLGNVARAAAAARQYENGVSVSLAGCAQWLDTALRSGSPAEEPAWMDENADAVYVTTVHASKGLEYPVVAIMQMERGAKNRRSSAALAASKTMGVALSDLPDRMKPDNESDNEPDNAPDNEPDNSTIEPSPESALSASESESKPLSLKWERALAEQGELEESARLFYVAATRAQDSLILCGVVGEEKDGERSVGNDSWLQWTGAAGPAAALDESEVIILSDSSDSESTPPPPTNGRAASPAFPTSPASPIPIPGPGAAPLVADFSGTSFALFEWCPFAWRRRHRQGLDLRWEIPDGLAGDDGSAIGGAELGTLAHWILARWDMRSGTLGDWLDEDAPGAARFLPAVLRDVWRNEKNRDALREWLSAFSLSAEGRALAAALRAGSLRREGAFRAALGEARLVGAVDVLWRDGGLWHVRDYKITLSDNAPAELYQAQLAFYALAVKLMADRENLRAGAQPVPFEGVDVGLIFLREGGRLGDTRLFRAEDDWAAMREQVTSAARAAAQGPWLPRRDRCRRCPWRAQCPKRN